MSESGQSWQTVFKGLPEEAARIRSWTASRVTHEDAPLIANELFVAVLGPPERRPTVVEMTISTSGRRIRLTATGTAPLPFLQIHGPGGILITHLSQTSGVSADFHSLWALLQEPLP
ncbi:hypothetical protein [Streptomyces sp. NPDC050504]|uniref:hypothetical protein n=1 Tax=Streptomyces sp. NPDC050504 TaxID=3365618 RepID=UPI0037B20DDA